ncbi:PAS domain S-box protein [aff. Roholtiella sp. LEGE 12411]|uniref:PAS domain S-box protein n=1 Tax=aff. Roholtiella sp. LEGE 12411 TaxID=1828822 RepID=UPI00187DDABD|nr:PAS domain S-box protein [aff. Roholtiella sp. LEGE 12411]MBE9037618.1 PAS domain S-box protein [aff. Roholtiella sp. LEGE 12411]
MRTRVATQVQIYNQIAIALGGIVALIGLVVMIAWHFHLTALVQLLPGAAPMRYNTALAFLLSGLALITLGCKQRGLASVLSVMVGGLGLLILAQYAFAVDFGIDQLLMQDYLTNSLYPPGSGSATIATDSNQQWLININRPRPGRPAPNTALGFALVGIALMFVNVTLRKNRPSLAGGLLAVGAIALSSVALLGYFSGLVAADDWGYFTGVAIHTAFGLLLLGIGILVLAVNSRWSRKRPRWLPLLPGLGIFLFNLFLWQATITWEQVNLLMPVQSFATCYSLLSPIRKVESVNGIFFALCTTLAVQFAETAHRYATKLKQSNHQLQHQILERQQVEAALKQAYDELEIRVRKRTAKLYQTKHRLRSLIEQAPFIIQRFAPDGSLLHTNPIWEQIWGTTRDTLKEYNLLEDPQVQELGHLSMIQKAFAGESVALPPVFYNPAISGCKGHALWIELFLYPIKDATDNVQEVVGIANNITERKQAEVVAQISQERFYRAILDAPVPIMLHAEDGEVIQINRTWSELTGYSLEEIPTIAAWTEKAHGKRQKLAIADIERLYKLNYRIYEGEYTITTADGKTRVWVFNSAPLGRSPDGRRVVISTALDVTERQRAQESLRESEQRLSMAIEGAGMATWDVDLLTQKALWSAQHFKLFGYKPVPNGEATLEMWHSRVHPDDLEQVMQALEHAQHERLLYCSEHRIIRVDNGQIIWVAVFGQFLYNQRGQGVRCVGILFDISNRKQAEEALQQANATLEIKVTERTAELAQSNFYLQESEARYRSVVSAVAEGIILQDGDGVIQTSNANAERILGLSLDQMMGQTSLDPRWRSVHQDGSPFPREQHPAMVALRTGKPINNVVMGVHKPDGSLTWISINSQPLFPTDGSVACAVVTSFADITERKRAEEQVQLLQTLALAIGEAEDFNTALTSILQTICETKSWNYGEAWVPNANATILQCSPAWYSDRSSSPKLDQFRIESQRTTFGIGLGLPGRVWASKQPEWCEDVSQSKTVYLRYQIALASGIKACLGIPLIANDQLLAVLVFFKFESWQDDPYLIPNITAIAAQLSSLLQRKRAEEALFQEKELAQVTLRSIGDAVITTDVLGQVQYLNPIAETLTGWNQAEAQGLPLTEVFRVVNETTREPVANPVEQALHKGCTVSLANHTILIARNGDEFAIDDSAAPIRASDNQVIGAVMVFHDVSHTRSLSRQLTWQASHDALTGLVNRHQFEYQMEQAINQAKMHNQQHALCYLDLDQFKLVNDTCGHFAGDELLRQVTAVFQSQVRKTDILARLGGDEFGLLLNQCPLEQAQQIANTLRDKVQELRFVWQGKLFTVGVSIGLVIIDAYSESIANVLSLADAACYVAKNRGRNRVHAYQADDLDLARQQGEMQWVTRLAHALDENRFRLYYQPIVPVSQTELGGEHYEVLLRLLDETGKVVSPMAFIPAAERYNLMHLIDRWVIRTLFATQGEHYRNTWSHCQAVDNCQSYLYAINLSGASINDDQFIEFLYEQFALHQIPPQTICFEITETVAITNLSKASQFIGELRNIGCRFALDDFGSGMSSFAYLKNLPVDFLKIDGSFIKHILDSSIDLAVVEAINQVGQALGIQTIAEFVENDAILEKIKALGVNYAQGYGIAKPCPFDLVVY